MIIINLDVMMAKRKMSLNKLSSEVGINIFNLSLLKNGRTKGFKFETLNILCRVLDCQPADLMEYIPGDDKGDERST